MCVEAGVWLQVTKNFSKRFLLLTSSNPWSDSVGVLQSSATAPNICDSPESPNFTKSRLLLNLNQLYWQNMFRRLPSLTHWFYTKCQEQMYRKIPRETSSYTKMSNQRRRDSIYRQVWIIDAYLNSNNIMSAYWRCPTVILTYRKGANECWYKYCNDSGSLLLMLSYITPDTT